MNNVTTNNKSGFKGILIVLVVVVLAVAAYAMLTAPDRRTTSERVGDAAEDVSRGNLGDAAHSMQDQTAGEKAANAVKDAGNDIRDTAK